MKIGLCLTARIQYDRTTKILNERQVRKKLSLSLSDPIKQNSLRVTLYLLQQCNTSKNSVVEVINLRACQRKGDKLWVLSILILNLKGFR